MPVIDMDTEVRVKKLSKEEETKKKVELAKAQIVKDQAIYREAFGVFLAEIEKLPTYGSFLEAIKKSCCDTPNEIIDLLLKQNSRDFNPMMKEIRAKLFADIILRMDKQ